MSLLREHRLSLAEARREARKLGAFLKEHVYFGERAVVALLKQCPNLTVLAGALGRGMVVADAYRYEFRIDGVVAADLVLRSRARRTIILVEFEGGAEDSVFARRATKQMRDWARSIDHATGQIIDWCWLMSEAPHSAILAANLGVEAADMQFLVVCGRDHALDSDLLRRRFAFRRAKLNIAGSSVVFLTYDGFYAEINHALTELGTEREASAPHADRD